MLFFNLFLMSCESAESTIKSSVLKNHPTVFHFSNESNIKAGRAYRKNLRKPVSTNYYHGDFLIKNFTVKDNGDNYILILEMNNRIDARGSKKGLLKELIDIYFFTPSGRHRYSLANRNVKFNKRWETAVLISPDTASNIKKELNAFSSVKDGKGSDYNFVKDVIIADKIKVKGRKIYVIIPREKLDHIFDSEVEVQILVSQFTPPLVSDDENNYVKNISTIKEIKSYDPNSYSDGLYSSGSPNIISHLGDNHKNRYVDNETSSKEFLTVDIVGNMVEEEN